MLYPLTMVPDVEERLCRCTKYLEELRDLTGGPPNQMGMVRRRSLQMIAEMAELREVLVGLAREHVSPKQAKMALSHTSEDDLNVDPGIRFVGVSFPDLMFRWSLTRSTILAFLSRVNRVDKEDRVDKADRVDKLDKVDRRGIDLIHLAGILQDLDRLEAEIGLHTEAVMAGRLKEEEDRTVVVGMLKEEDKTVVVGRLKKEEDTITSNKVPEDVKKKEDSFKNETKRQSPVCITLDETKRQSPTQKSTKRRSFRTTKVSVEKSKSFHENGSQRNKVKYKKCKTTDLCSPIEKVRRKSHTTMRPENCITIHKSLSEKNLSQSGEMEQPKRKTSFIDHMSNLFKGIL